MGYASIPSWNKEDEREGEYVTSKVFYQQQQAKLGDKYD